MPCLAGSLSPAFAAIPETVTVVMVDNSFQPDHVVFHANRPTVLRLVNRGKDMHEFTAPAFLRSTVVNDPRQLANGGTDIVVQPGQTVTVQLVAKQKGGFDLSCADHDWDGMTGHIDVK